MFLGVVFREDGGGAPFVVYARTCVNVFLNNFIIRYLLNVRDFRIGWLPNASLRIGRAGPDVSGHAILEIRMDGAHRGDAPYRTHAHW